MRLFPSRHDNGRGQSFLLWRWMDILGDNGIYLTRLTLFRCPLFSVLVHWIRRPDEARDPHCHPWPFLGIVMRGGYEEQRLILDKDRKCWIGVKYRKLRRFSVNRMDTKTPHRIVSVLPNTTTLIFCGRKIKNWGFYVVRRDTSVDFVPWRRYLGLSEDSDR